MPAIQYSQKWIVSRCAPVRLQCRLNLPDFKFRREFDDVRGSWYRDTDNGEDEDGDEDEDREEDEMDYDDGLDFGDD